MYKLFKSFILLFICLLICNSLFSKNIDKPGNYKVSSPDGNTLFHIKNQAGNLSYSVTYQKSRIIVWSALGFVYNNIEAGKQTAIVNTTSSTHNEKFAWRLGESDTVYNNYNSAVFKCTDNGLRYNILVRVYNGSVAFRYQIAQQNSDTKSGITKELTTFVFKQPLTLYQYNQETVFTPVSIDSLYKTCDLPATLTDHQNTYISIGEADNENYTKAELRKGSINNSLQVAFMHDSIVNATAGFETPWRTISYANTAIGLHQFSDLYLRLVEPVADSIPSWIIPGKLIRSQLTTADGIRCVDFATTHNLQYVLFDAGWYGKEFRSTSDPTTYIKELDIPKVIAYGKSKNVGIILYVNYVGLRNYLDQIIPLYKKWGVAGMKFGFVDGLTQKGITWLTEAVRKVTDAGIIVDVHDNYKPTGLSRKFPGWLTQEGIRGDENSPDAFHTTVLPFTRFLAGPADFTFCYPNSKNSFSKNLKVSMAQQLALTVIYFSPLQSMFWYGRPENYTNEEEIAFFKYVPTVWDESRYLVGEIGKYISVARRSGDTWFVGNAAGLQDWNGRIKFDFLKPGVTYSAMVYEDGTNGGIAKKVLGVRRGNIFRLHLKASSGTAMILTPETNDK